MNARRRKNEGKGVYWKGRTGKILEGREKLKGRKGNTWEGRERMLGGGEK